MVALYGQLLGVKAIMPAPMSIASFRTHVFGDQSKDPEIEQYTNLLRPFLINVINDVNNLGPAILRSQITAKGANLDTLDLTTLHDGVAKVYLCHQNLNQPLGQPHKVRYKKF